MSSPLPPFDPERPFCVLYTTPRSGSHFLMGSLALNGIALLAEYFSPYRKHMTALSPPGIDAPTRAAVLRDIYALDASRAKSRIAEAREDTRSMRCYGTKLFPAELELILASHGSLESFFAQPRIHHLYLKRRDTVRQAISQYLARHTGEWFRYHPDEPEQEVPYDPQALRAIRADLEAGYRRLESFFEHQGLEPLTLDYETLLEDLAGAIRQVAEHCGCPLPPGQTPRLSSLFVRQSGPAAERLHARFLEDEAHASR